MLRTTLLATTLALTLSTGASAAESSDQAARLDRIDADNRPVVEWSLVPRPGFLATEGGYTRVRDPEPGRRSAVVVQSTVPAPGSFATEGGYASIAEVAPPDASLAAR